MNELLNGEIFHTLKEAKILIEQRRVHYNTVRPHNVLKRKPPAGQKVTMRSLDFWCCEEGLIQKNWGLVDLLDVYTQLEFTCSGEWKNLHIIDKDDLVVEKAL